jgi:hypothetical protein
MTLIFSVTKYADLTLWDIRFNFKTEMADESEVRLQMFKLHLHALIGSRLRWIIQNNTSKITGQSGPFSGVTRWATYRRVLCSLECHNLVLIHLIHSFSWFTAAQLLRLVKLNTSGHNYGFWKDIIVWNCVVSGLYNMYQGNELISFNSFSFQEFEFKVTDEIISSTYQFSWIIQFHTISYHITRHNLKP